MGFQVAKETSLHATIRRTPVRLLVQPSLRPGSFMFRLRIVTASRTEALTPRTLTSGHPLPTQMQGGLLSQIVTEMLTCPNP